jgi:hypothetical protein
VNDGLLIEEAVEISAYKLLDSTDRNNLDAIFKTHLILDRVWVDRYDQSLGKSPKVLVEYMYLVLKALGENDTAENFKEVLVFLAKNATKPVEPVVDWAKENLEDIVRRLVIYENHVEVHKQVTEVENELVKMALALTKDDVAEAIYNRKTLQKYKA